MSIINVGPQCCVDGCYRKHIKGHGMCREHQDMYDRGLKLIINYGHPVQKILSQSKKSADAELTPEEKSNDSTAT